jgi:hypothetical protein
MNPKFNRKAFLKTFPPDSFDYSESYEKLIQYIIDIEQTAYQAGYYKRANE